MKTTFIRCVILSALLVLPFVSTKADSPLTSTQWWEEYYQQPIIQTAKTNGFNETIQNYLCDNKNSIDVRLAVVNCQGWDFEGYNRFKPLLETYRKLYKLQGLTDEQVLKSISPQTRCVFAYLLALDNYFDITQALSIAKSAWEQEPTSLAISMIYGLISAQYMMDNLQDDEIYPLVAGFAYNEHLKKDMSDYAVEQIMDYINLYKDNAEAWRLQATLTAVAGIPTDPQASPEWQKAQGNLLVKKDWIQMTWDETMFYFSVADIQKADNGVPVFLCYSIQDTETVIPIMVAGNTEGQNVCVIWFPETNGLMFQIDNIEEKHTENSPFR